MLLAEIELAVKQLDWMQEVTDELTMGITEETREAVEKLVASSGAPIDVARTCMGKAMLTVSLSLAGLSFGMSVEQIKELEDKVLDLVREASNANG